MSKILVTGLAGFISFHHISLLEKYFGEKAFIEYLPMQKDDVNWTNANVSQNQENSN